MNFSVKKLVKNYRDIPVPVKASIWFTICSIIQNGFHMITMPIYTRLLTTEEYGISTLYFAWLDIVSIFVSLKLSAGVFNNGMVRFKTDRDRFQSSMLGLSTVTGCACIILYFLFQQYFISFLELPNNLIIWMLIYCTLHPAILYWTARQRYEYKYIGFTLVTLGMIVITSACSIAAIILSDNRGEDKIVAYTVSTIAIAICFYCLLMKRGKTFYHKKYWIYALKFNLPLIPHYLSMIVLNQADRIMISRMCGSSQAAMYGVVYNLGKIALLFNSAITASFTPWIYEKLDSGKSKDVKEVSTALFIFIGIVVFLMTLFAPELLMIFAAPEYSQAVYVIPPIATQVFFIFIYNQVSTVEFYYGKPVYIMVISVIGAILNIVLNYFAIGSFGYIAAAYTSLICYIFFAFFHCILMRKLCIDNNIREDIFGIRRIIIMSIVMLCFLAVSNLLYTSFILRYCFIIITIILLILKRQYVVNIVKALRSK